MSKRSLALAIVVLGTVTFLGTGGVDARPSAGAAPPTHFCQPSGGVETLPDGVELQPAPRIAPRRDRRYRPWRGGYYRRRHDGRRANVSRYEGTTICGGRRKALAGNYKYYPIEIALFSPVHLFHPARKTIIGLSLNILYGKTHRAFGLEVGAVLNRELEDFGGIQLAGGANWVGRNVYGIQVAGIANHVDGGVYGLQLAGFGNGGKGGCAGLCVGGFVNWHGCLKGVQISSSVNWIAKSGRGIMLTGAYNRVKEDFKGLQLTLGLNMVYGHFSGLQLSLVNLNNVQTTSYTSGRYVYGTRTTYLRENRGVQIGGLASFAYRFSGLQISGLVNGTFESMLGVQISAAVNYATKEMEGLQLGAFNYARHVRGVQIGLVNIAGSLAGLQLGVINVAWKNKWPFMVGILVGGNKGRYKRRDLQ